MAITRRRILLLSGMMPGFAAAAMAQPQGGGPPGRGGPGYGPGMGPGRGMGPGYGPGMGGPGMGPGGGMGMMGGAFGDPAAYLDSLKRELRITPDQEGAWATYADAVKGTAAQMQGVRQSMWDSMPTANWQERRDMMNNMFQAHQQAFDTVHAAAEALLPALSSTQAARARERLPGLRSGGGWMHGGRGRGMGPPYSGR